MHEHISASTCKSHHVYIDMYVHVPDEGAPGDGQGCASRTRGILLKGRAGMDHHRHAVYPCNLPLPSASALSMTLKYFHLLWELPVQLPVVLGLFFFSCFFFLRL